jgi:Magnesium chelatase, subunit ChlI
MIQKRRPDFSGAAADVDNRKPQALRPQSPCGNQHIKGAIPKCAKEPSPPKPVKGAAQPEPNVQKTLDTSSICTLSAARRRQSKPLSPAELPEVSMIASVAGEIDCGARTNRRPFRAPHHSASTAALGGGCLLRMIPIPQTNRVRIKSGFAVPQQ